MHHALLTIERGYITSFIVCVLYTLLYCTLWISTAHHMASSLYEADNSPNRPFGLDSSALSPTTSDEVVVVTDIGPFTEQLRLTTERSGVT